MGLVPVRYPNSETSADDAVRLVRKTQWQALGGEGDAQQYAGLGQRVLTTNADEIGLLDIRELSLAVPDA